MKAHQKAFSRFLSACFVHTLLRLFASMQGVIITPPSLWFLSFCLRLCVCSHETTGFWLKRNNLCSDSRDTQQTPLKFRWPAISQCLSYTHTHAQTHKVTHEREETSCLERFDLQNSAGFCFTLDWVCVPPEDICALFSAVFAIFVSFLRFEIPTLSPSLSLCTTHLIKQQSPFGCGFNGVSPNAHFQVIMPAFLLETSSVSKVLYNQHSLTAQWQIPPTDAMTQCVRGQTLQDTLDTNELRHALIRISTAIFINIRDSWSVCKKGLSATFRSPFFCNFSQL